MHVVLTRPRSDSEPLAALLRAHNNDVHIEPMLEIVATGEPVSFDGIQAVLATSANGVRYLATATDRRDLPLYAVGDATALSAREAGFTSVESAQGDSSALAGLVTAQLDPAAGGLLHARGRDSAGDLSGDLETRGFTVKPAVLYRAEPARQLSVELRERLAAEKIDSILFFSPRTARTFVSLTNDAGFGDHCRRITAICLSPAVADAAAALPWNDVRIAATPDQTAMIHEFDRLKMTKDTKQS